MLRVARVLDRAGVPHMFIGGVAVNVWGYTRPTRDVDLTVWVDDGRIAEIVALLSTEGASRRPDPVPFVHQSRIFLLRLDSGVDVDVAFGTLPFEEEAIRLAAVVEIGGATIRVCRVRDLVLHKVISDRPQDVDDVRFLITRYGASLDRAEMDRTVKELADSLARPETYRIYLGHWEG